MKTLRVAALLFTAMFVFASSASAIQITLTSYSVDYNDDEDDGLAVDVNAIEPFGGDETTPNLTTVGQSYQFRLFELESDENSVGGNDNQPQDIRVTFNFSSPAGTGNISGDTVGGIAFQNLSGSANDFDYDFGRVTWDGPLTVTFSGGQFQVSLTDTTFWCEGDCTPGPGEFNGADILATITLTQLTQTPVDTSAPEPASILLLGTGLAFAARRLRKQKP